jgi:hypothetical protein
MAEVPLTGLSFMDQVSAAESRWPAFAEEAGCPKKTVTAIGACFHDG